MKKLFGRFWAWYENHQTLNLAIITLIFVWQIAHLYWLTTDVVILRLFSVSLFNPSKIIEFLIIVADYLEIPVIVGASVVYINSIRKKGINIKDLSFLAFINSQWLHIFWITDEFVIKGFFSGASTLPIWLVWVAIGIDYFELPVIYDVIKRFLILLRMKLIQNRP